MQGVIANPSFYVPVALKHQYRKPVNDHVEVSTTASSFSLPSKETSPRLKIKAPLVISKQPKDDSFLLNLQFSPLKRVSYLSRASKGSPFSVPPYPKMTEKPKWWWSVACLPYLMNFLDHLTWAYAHPTSNPPPFLENFDNLAFPLHSSLLALPKFFLSCYPIMFYYWVVRRKEWPHFLRFHVISAVLFGSLVQVIGISSNWVPSRFFPPHFWSAATFFFLVTVLECFRCALTGQYSSIPFVKDAALLH